MGCTVNKINCLWAGTHDSRTLVGFRPRYKIQGSFKFPTYRQGRLVLEGLVAESVQRDGGHLRARIAGVIKSTIKSPSSFAVHAHTLAEFDFPRKLSKDFSSLFLFVCGKRNELVAGSPDTRVNMLLCSSKAVWADCILAANSGHHTLEKKTVPWETAQVQTLKGDWQGALGSRDSGMGVPLRARTDRKALNWSGIALGLKR